MFVPVACLRCSKLFQVAPDTPARPVAADTPAPPPAPEPLSLDDADPLPAAPRPPIPPAKPKGEFRLDAVLPPTEPRASTAARAGRRSLKELAFVAVAWLVVAALTVAVLGFRSGRGGGVGWVEFTAPDGSFSGTFPATPTAAKVEPNGKAAVTLGGEEYAAAGWYSGVRAWVAWQDLDPVWVKRLADDKDGMLATPALEAERDRRVRDAGGTLVENRTKTVQTTYGRGFEVEVDTPNGKRVERYVLAANAAKPRLYVIGVEGPKLDPDGPLPARVMTRFRIN